MPTARRLTPRQYAFFTKLQDLYQEHQRPVHYSEVAERLGVSRFSAYDMLRVLEEKGLALSGYALAADHSGPGRSMVVFSPASPAVLGSGGRSDNLGQDLVEDWPTTRERVLGWLREARNANHREALNDLLDRLPDAQAPLSFCAEMIGALLLNMRRVKARAGMLHPFRALAAILSSGGANLETLAGLSVGATLSADDEFGPSTTQRLLAQMQRYQASLSRLGHEARQVLAQFLEEALQVLE